MLNQILLDYENNILDPTILMLQFIFNLDYLFQINLLTTVMSDAPVLPDEDEEDALPMLMDSPQCVGFGIFVIW